MCGSCLMTMVMAKPNAKPRNTGLEMNAAKWPRRAAAASANSAPTSSTMALVNTTAWLAATLEVLIVATAAARMAADDEVGVTMA